jgi:putative membrane protein
MVTLLRHLNRTGRVEQRLTAEELLAERFARGEITEQEYRERLDVLRRSRAGADS